MTWTPLSDALTQSVNNLVQAFIERNSTMTSIAKRKAAAELHTAWTASEEAIYAAEDANASPAEIQALEEAADRAREAYLRFSWENEINLMEDSSGLHLKCAKTGVPLLIGDKVEEIGDTGEFVLKATEAA